MRFEYTTYRHLDPPFILPDTGASCLTSGFFRLWKKEKKSKGLICQPMGNSVWEIGQRKNSGEYNKMCSMLQV